MPHPVTTRRPTEARRVLRLAQIPPTAMTNLAPARLKATDQAPTAATLLNLATQLPAHTSKPLHQAATEPHQTRATAAAPQLAHPVPNTDLASTFQASTLAQAQADTSRPHQAMAATPKWAMDPRWPHLSPMETRLRVVSTIITLSTLVQLR